MDSVMEETREYKKLMLDLISNEYVQAERDYYGQPMIYFEGNIAQYLTFLSVFCGKKGGDWTIEERKEYKTRDGMIFMAGIESGNDWACYGEIRYTNKQDEISKIRESFPKM